MTSVTPLPGLDQVAIGVDTHKDFHVAVALNGYGARLSELTFAANRRGFDQLEQWSSALGPVLGWGVEGTSSYGAGLTRHLLAAGHRVLEVNRPDRHARRTLGGKRTRSMPRPPRVRCCPDGPAPSPRAVTDGWRCSGTSA
jgi:hypothetical protein